MPTYPGDPPVSLSAVATVEVDGYRTSTLSMGTHAGTHVDAPAHTEPDGRTLDEFPVSTFQFEALRLDVSGMAPRSSIEQAALREAIAPVDFQSTDGVNLVVLHTGWEQYWKREEYNDHPFLSADAAAWLTANDFHVGIDAPSVDPTPSPNAQPDEPDGFPVHHELLGSGQLIVENLCNLSALPDNFALHAYPLALSDADAAPVRAVAVSESDGVHG